MNINVKSILTRRSINLRHFRLKVGEFGIAHVMCEKPTRSAGLQGCSTVRRDVLVDKPQHPRR